MTLYTRHQLGVLLVLLGAAGLGLAVGHWRRAHPDLVDRIETLDRSPAPLEGSLATRGRAPASRESSTGRRSPPRALARKSAATPDAGPSPAGVPRAVIVDVTSQTEH